MSITDITFNYNWEIENFSQYEMQDFLVTCNWFSLRGQVSWEMKMYPLDGPSSNFVSLALFSNIVGIDIKVQFYILNPRQYNDQKEHKFDWKTSSVGAKVDEFLNWAEIKRCKSTSKGDTVTINCKITVSDECFEGLQRSLMVKIPKSNLENDLNKLINNPDSCSDVTLSVDGHVFHAHKSILSARCPVFYAMFKNNMTENLNNSVEIPDVSQGAMKEVLRFIYTGRVQNFDNLAGELLACAEKYNLGRLKAMCEQVLCADLSIQNVIKTLVMADFHAATQLKEETMCFFFINASLLDQEEVEAALVSHPRLMAEAIRSLSSGHLAKRARLS